MNKRNLQNEELDRIGRKLLGTARMQSKEIEQVVGSPMLFGAVKARIETEHCERNSKNIFGNRTNFQIWKWHSASAIILFLFMAGVIGLIVFGKLPRNRQSEQAAAPEINWKVEPIEIQPSPIKTKIPEYSAAIVRKKISVVESPKITKQKNFNNKINQPEKSAARKSNLRQRRFQHNQNESADEFYALTFAGNSVETGEELQIVRAELSRSSLFALGVNLPIENESEKIKTDLLVGADGVARAIRLVNKTENQ